MAALGKVARLFSGRSTETTALPEKPDELKALEQDFLTKIADNTRASRRLQTCYLNNIEHTESVRTSVASVVKLWNKSR